MELAERLDEAQAAVDASDFTSYVFQHPPLALWKARPGLPELREAWGRAAGAWGRYGLYLHVPFCRTKCTFCRFFVIESEREEHRRAFLDALEAEARLLGAAVRGTPASTLYVGGGTPSLLSVRELERVFRSLQDRFDLASVAQTAFEANPEFLDLEKAELLRAFGVDRLTIGVQSFDDGVVKAVERTQSPGSVRRAYDAARAAGIPWINLDLMCGLPGQDLRGYLRDVREALRLEPDMIHTSAFLPTPFTRFIQRGGSLGPADRRAIGAMHAAGVELMSRFGYRRIRHDAWGLREEARNVQLEESVLGGVPHLGLGPGAVSSATGELRYVNHGSLGGYAGSLREGRPPVLRGHVPSARDERTNHLLNHFWYGELDRTAYRRRFGEEVEASFGPVLEALLSRGLLLREEPGYRLAAFDDRHVQAVRRALLPEGVLRALAGARGGRG